MDAENPRRSSSVCSQCAQPTATPLTARILRRCGDRQLDPFREKVHGQRAVDGTQDGCVRQLRRELAKVIDNANARANHQLLNLSIVLTTLEGHQGQIEAKAAQGGARARAEDACSARSGSPKVPEYVAASTSTGEPTGSADRRAAGHECHRVDCARFASVSVEMYFEVQVWSAAVAGRSHVADYLSGGHLLAEDDEWFRQHVAVAGDYVVGVADVGVPAAAGCVGRSVAVASVAGRFDVASDDDDGAGRHDADGCASGGSEVGAVVARPLGCTESRHERCIDWLDPAGSVHAVLGISRYRPRKCRSRVGGELGRQGFPFCVGVGVCGALHALR